jgi:hypothetical protein
MTETFETCLDPERREALFKRMCPTIPMKTMVITVVILIAMEFLSFGLFQIPSANSGGLIANPNRVMGTIGLAFVVVLTATVIGTVIYKAYQRENLRKALADKTVSINDQVLRVGNFPAYREKMDRLLRLEDVLFVLVRNDRGKIRYAGIPLGGENAEQILDALKRHRYPAVRTVASEMELPWMKK